MYNVQNFDNFLLGKKKIKKQKIIHFARNVRVLRHTLWNVVKHCFVRLQSLKPAVSTLIHHWLNGDLFIIRIQCCVLEVLKRIISNYLFLNHKTLTAEN